VTTSEPTPNYRTGKICYVEIPALDSAQSAQFYQRVFGWSIRQHVDGATAFDDTVGGVSGMWVLGRTPMTVPGLVVSIMVADAAAILDAIVSNGGAIVQPINPDEDEIYAQFSDPAGNVLGVYQQSGLAESEAAAQ